MFRSIRSLLVAATSLALLTVAGATGVSQADTTGTSTTDSTTTVLSCQDSTSIILDVPHQLFAAWDNGDAAGIAAVFTTDGHMITSNGSYLVGRQAITDYYTAGFAGPLAGTREIGKPLSERCISNNYAIIDGLGGLLLPGETYTDPSQVPIGRRIIVSWVAQRVYCNTWQMTEFQATTIAG